MKKYGYTAENMAQYYGKDWYIYQEPLKCPHCGVNLCDKEHGPPFKREIGIEDDRSDKVSHYQCPDCEKTIPRED
jgi:transposase-like protein